MKCILNTVKKKYTFHDLGFCLTTFFYFVLLPVLVCFFNPDDSGLSPTDLIVTGLAISCLLSFCYFIVNILVFYGDYDIIFLYKNNEIKRILQKIKIGEN